MGFLEDLTKKASGIVSKGKNFLADQLSTETVYKRDASGNMQMVSDTGNKPKIVKTVKEFLVPGRGYTDAQIAAAKSTKKETVVGVAKAAGEIVQGGLTLTHMLGNKIADTVLPGYDAEAKASYRNILNEKVSTKLTPKTAGEAKVMRGVDILGLLPVGSVSKLSKLEALSDVARNSLKTEKLGVQEKSLEYFRNNPDKIKTGEVRLRELEDGSIFIEDGRHRLEVGREKGITPNIIDVTAEYTGKPSAKIESIINDIKSTPDKPIVNPPQKVKPEVKSKSFKDADELGGQYSITNTDISISLKDGKYTLSRNGKPLEGVSQKTQELIHQKRQAANQARGTGAENSSRATAELNDVIDQAIREADAGDFATIQPRGVGTELRGTASKEAQRIGEKLRESGELTDDIISQIENNPSEFVRNYKAKNTPTSPIKSITTPKQFDIPKKPTGEIDVDGYVTQQTKAREAARGEGKTIKSKVIGFLQNLENKMVDFTAPIQRRVDAAKKSDPLSFGDKADIKDNIDRVFNAPAITSAFVKEKGFAKAVQSIDEADLDAFDQYLTAKHAMDLDAKGIKTGRNMEADSALVAQMGSKFENAAKEIQKYNDARLEYMVESGLISRELKDELLKKHPNYVPFQRVFSEDELAAGGDFGGGSGVASLSKQSVVQKIVGSEREIESPLESLLELTNKAVQQGEKNKAALTLTSYADIKGNPFGLRKISKTTDAAPDKDTISVLRNGKKEIWEVDADVAKAAKALDVERMNILGKIIAAPLRLARLGITGVFNPAFMLANVARDQVSSFIFSDNGLRSSAANPRIFGAALAEAIGHGKLYDEMLSEGALMTSFDVARDAVKPTLKSIVADKSRVSKLKFVAKNPSQWFRQLEDAVGRSEEVARIQQYAGNKQAALSQGMTESQARNYAARAARENSTNFARRGEWGTVMNNTILYIGAGIQGSRLLVRNLKNKPIQTSTKIVTTLMLPVATATYWNLKDPERKRIYDEEIQDWEKENNLIIILPGAKEGEDGRWEGVLKYPLPPGVGQFANFVRRPIEQSYGLDEVEFKEAAENLLRVVSPTDLTNPINSLMPQALKPGVQATTNTNLFTGYDIVPKSMQDLPVDQQIKDTTSGTAIDIAKILGTSPIKTEQFINDIGGAIGPQLLNAADRIRGEEQVGGRSISENILRRFTSAAGGKLEADQLDEIYSLRTEARGNSNELKKTAVDTLAELRNMPKEQANIELKRIFDENRPLYDAINKARKQEERGLTKVEAALEDLPVKDGTRAAYIYSEFLEIQKSSPEDAQAYIVELRKKGIVSDEVFKQLKELKELDQ